MKLLIVGTGGREMALYKKVKQSKRFTSVYQCPFNSCFDHSIDASTNDEIVQFCKSEEIDLCIIGPENFLYNDLATDLENNGIRAFGPNKEAAKLEWSKSFAKDLMDKYNIPTAKYKSFKDLQLAKAFLNECSFPLVIKEDGLASGKGVYILDNIKEAVSTLDTLFSINSSSVVVIEEFLVGEELSVFALVDGDKYKILPVMKDYKKIYDDDKGPNTGGMGARTFNKYNDKMDKIEREIIIPTVNCLIDENIKYTGVIYFGLICCGQEFYVIEYNARFGDPETEVLMEKLESNIGDVIYDFLQGKDVVIEERPDEYVGVVLASNGYPSFYEKGMEMDYGDINLIEMNMTYEDNKYYTNGGRVAIVVGKGKSIDEAKENVYNDLNKVNFENMYFRKDIGK